MRFYQEFTGLCRRLPHPEDRWSCIDAVEGGSLDDFHIVSKINELRIDIELVQEVCDLIKGLPGCADYADDFLIHKIDGQALMLLKEDHLMTSISCRRSTR
ncbi:hypothetical protein GWI33_006150 [Rhynchophorus ferrugineus]|uniref:SAM domain-containing protein n=1 Tax=Rhynchophorus ferrugineus TaxID=354439 RepID=A0A834MHK5_RHYFE|nr:hypothetical protein GWI33_006150 [Rhynchophorus ferrugineus]